jgi:hypothetical protein
MIEQVENGVLLKVHVIPNSSKTEVVGIYNDMLKLKLNVPPVDGKANEAIIKFFSKILDISKSKVEILKGEKSKDKLILLKGVSKDLVLKVLNINRAGET